MLFTLMLVIWIFLCNVKDSLLTISGFSLKSYASVSSPSWPFNLNRAKSSKIKSSSLSTWNSSPLQESQQGYYHEVLNHVQQYFNYNVAVNISGSLRILPKAVEPYQIPNWIRNTLAAKYVQLGKIHYVTLTSDLTRDAICFYCKRLYWCDK